MTPDFGNWGRFTSGRLGGHDLSVEQTFNPRSRTMRGLVAVALVAFGATGCGYNTIQTNDEAAGAAKQQISVQLQRRADLVAVSYTHLRAHETPEHLVCRLLLEK